jgi:hypothetical protein
MLAETSTVLRQKQYGFCQILSAGFYPPFRSEVPNSLRHLCQGEHNEPKGKIPPCKPASRHRVAGCDLTEATITTRADAARMLFDGEDLFKGDGQGAQKKERAEWPPPYQVVFCGTKLALPAHLLELAKQTGGDHQSRDLRQREYGQQRQDLRCKHGGARVTSGSGKHRSPCECGDTPWNVRLTQKNRPLAGYRPLGPIVAVVVLIAIFDDRPF